MSEIVMTPEFRVSFPVVFSPKLNDLSGKTEYSIVALFGKGADLSALHAAAKAAIEDKWGPDKSKHPKGLKSPFRDQGEKKYGGYEEGNTFMTFKSAQRPGLVNADKVDIIDERDFYAGCYARATVRAYAYDNKGNRGVAFGLQNIQKLREGEPLGGRVAPQKEFEAVGSQAADDDFFS